LFTISSGSVLYGTTACSGQFPRTTLDFTPAAGHVYTLSLSLNNPDASLNNCLIGFSPYAQADKTYDAGTLIDGFWVSGTWLGSGSVRRDYNGGIVESSFTTAGAGNGYWGHPGELDSNFELVLDTTVSPWKTSTSMSSGLGTLSGAVLDAVGSPTSVHVWVRDPGNGFFPTISNFRLTDTSFGTSGNYVSWAAAQTPPLTGGPSAVGPDGIPNLLVYALDLKTDGTNGSPGTLAGSVLSFGKRTDAVANGDVSYAIETSTTLRDEITPGDGGWTTATTGVTDNSATISIDLSTLGGSSHFARLVVTQN